ncbi:MAG: HAMP domain-containing protein, partial [Acidobacteria bacterium]|nr:HAMP domain-containing protein [Acidobacteriota bacterium]
EVSGAGPIVGFVRTSIPLTLLHTRRFRLQMGLLSGAAIAALLGLALSFPLARRVTRPLYSMTTVAESLAQGDYEQRVPVDSEDEVGTLARTFNHMAGELEERIQTIDRDRHQLLAILGSMVEGVVALDPEEQVVHMNRAAGQLLEADPAASVGRKIWELIRVPAISQALTEAMAGGVNSGEARIAAEADDRILELHATPLRHSGGAVLVLYDVTDLRRLEAMRRDFVANVSHELKTPVTAILGIIETILDDPDMGTATTERFLAKIRDNSRRLASLVSDLLTLSRLESGDRFLEHRILDLRRPLEEAVRSQYVHAEQKGVVLEVGLPEEEVKVRGDHEALREAIENLLSNAVRYSPQDGEVRIGLTRKATEVEITVCDNGPGIEPKHQERIFERFYRVDRARSREVGGTGLGLSIVKHISLSHGGSVAVESQPGEGSTFRIRLPLAG